MTNALLGVGRLNNFRLNALAPSLVQIRRTKGRIILNGVDVRERVRVHSLTIRDAINDSPNTCAFAIEALPVANYAATVLADQPLAYWRLGDVTASALDQTGRGHIGTLVGSVAVNQPGAVADGDRAMYFPGVTGARVEVAAAPDLVLSTGVSIEAWVKTGAPSQLGGLLEKTVGGVVATAYSLFQANATWYFRVVLGGTLIDLSLPVDPADVGQWVHLVAGWSSASSAMWIYRNGVIAASITTPAGSLAGGAGPLFLGHLGLSSDGGTRYYPFTGTLDEVAIYSYLGPDRIAAHFAASRPPVAGATIAQELRITVGVDDPVLLFNGSVTQVDLTYEGRARTPIYQCAATDDTLRANRRRPFGQWTNVSATTVAQAIVASFIPGFGADYVQPNLPPVTVIFDGSEGLNRCLTQITNLIGGYWYFADRQLHLFLAEATDAPDPLDDAHAFLETPRLAASIDMSQLRTRVYGRGHGEALLSAVVAGESLIPIPDAVMFNIAGGRAIALSQVMQYTGVYLGGAGSLVGPGAAPTVALNLAPQAGTALGSGTYQYAYTNVTAAGESLPGPRATIAVGLVDPPATGPTVGPPTFGPGVDAGQHLWGVTFLLPSGETTLYAGTAASTTVTPPPAQAPSPQVQLVSGAAGDPHVEDNTYYEYAITFYGPASSGLGGETTPGPISAAVLTPAGSPTQLPAPVWTSSPYESPAEGGNNGNYWHFGDAIYYVLVYETSVGTTNGSQSSTLTVSTPAVGGYPAQIRVPLPSPVDPSVTTQWLWRNVNGAWVHKVQLTPAATSYVDWGGNTYPTAPPTTNTTTITRKYPQVSVTGIPTPDSASPEVLGRGIYRRKNLGGAWGLVAYLQNRTATTYTDAMGTGLLGNPPPAVSQAYRAVMPLTAIPLGPAGITLGRNIYRTKANQITGFLLLTQLLDNTTTVYTDRSTDASLAAKFPPSVNTASANRVALSGIALGASTVTARKVYRTTVNGAQLKLLTTIADNVTLTYADAIADGALGATVPTSDTSGLQQPQGQTNAGSATLPTASAGPFRAPEGWAIIGTQAIRYTGIAGNGLTGIPATGPGSITATVRYGDHILAASLLTGVTVPGGALLAQAGDVVYLWVQRDDAAAQAAMAALDGLDGIYEYLVQDERRGEPSLVALCDAHLAAYHAPIETVTYATRDLKTKSGKPVVVNLAQPPIAGTLVIQDVTIDQIDVSPGLAPRFVVTASTLRFSLEDLLRQLTGSLEG